MPSKFGESENKSREIGERDTGVLHGVEVSVRGALVHSQRGRLSVGLPAMATGVRLTVRVDHVMLIKTGVLRETLPTAGNRTQIRLLT